MKDPPVHVRDTSSNQSAKQRIHVQWLVFLEKHQHSFSAAVWPPPRSVDVMKCLQSDTEPDLSSAAESFLLFSVKRKMKEIEEESELLRSVPSELDLNYSAESSFVMFSC
ncbi:hypothetical protein JOB18_008387 [Solea senegalensis]|uniref:Uncharacterized protein n=1 Tax=Solea senegalensis TaxID=28829 RepID=A0AAV6QMK6_SOLSE|nr:hypothetical protein JOB18_008387 [Solea senegalensis]